MPPPSPAAPAPDQVIEYNGQHYSFPADAKDNEILSFINGGSPTGVQSPIRPPKFQPRPPAVAMEQSQPANDIARSILKPVLQYSAPNMAYQALRKKVPSLDTGEGVGAPEYGRQGMINAGLGMGFEGAMEPELASEGGLAASRGLARGATRSSVSPSATTDAASASSLLSKIPGKQSVTQDVLDFIAPSTGKRLSAGRNLLDRVRSIIDKHNAGTPEEIEANPPSPDANQFSFSHRMTGPVGGKVGEPPAQVQAPKLQRPAPAWQQAASSDTSTGTEVPSLLKRGEEPQPRMRDIPSAEWNAGHKISPKVENTPTNKLIRKSPPPDIQKSIREIMEPEGRPFEPGVGPGAMLRKSEPITRVYHGTGAEAGPNISREGITHNMEIMGKYEGPFVTTDEGAAERYAIHGDHDPSDFYDDDNIPTRFDSAYPAGRHGAVIAADIPSRWLKKAPQLYEGEYNLNRGVPPEIINHQESRVLHKPGREEILDDQTVKSRIESRLRQKHSQPWSHSTVTDQEAEQNAASYLRRYPQSSSSR